ncbi:hypothetical protein PSHT_02126, partial [Puccinia striiformis]
VKLSSGGRWNTQPVQITEDSVKPEEEIQLHIEADRQSKASSSQFSREDSPIRSQTTSHQLTNDDWPVTPPSPDCFPSPDLMSRLASPHSIDSGNSIKFSSLSHPPQYTTPRSPHLPSIPPPVGPSTAGSPFRTTQF